MILYPYIKIPLLILIVIISDKKFLLDFKSTLNITHKIRLLGIGVLLQIYVYISNYNYTYMYSTPCTSPINTQTNYAYISMFYHIKL